MKLKKILTQLTTLLALLVFTAGLVHASPYGSGAYGECLYDGEAGSCDIIDPSAQDKGGESAAEDTEDEEPAAEDEEPAPADSFDDSVPPAVSAVDPLDDGGLGMAPIIGAIAALIGSLLLIFWASRRRRERAVATPPANTYAPAPPVQPTPPPQPQPAAAPEPQTDPTAKTDVNLAPSGVAAAAETTGQTHASADSQPVAAEEPAAAAEPSTPQHQTPQVGETVAPQASEAGSTTTEGTADQPAPQSDATPAGISHRDIHGPGQS